MYRESVFKLVGQLQRGRPGEKTVRKKEPKNTKIEISQKKQRKTSRGCKGAVGDIGVSLTPGVGNCECRQK